MSLLIPKPVLLGGSGIEMGVSKAGPGHPLQEKGGGHWFHIDDQEIIVDIKPKQPLLRPVIRPLADSA